MELPLLDHTSSLFKNISLERVRLIGVQHLLGTTRAMLEHLFQHHNLDPASTHILGKCYSTHPETAQRLIEQGVNVHPLSTHFDRRFSFDSYHGGACADLLGNIQDHASPCVLVDDGGGLISEVIFRDFDYRNPIYVGIEQTSSGYNRNHRFFHPRSKYERLPRFHLINIARSEPKLALETPFIIESILVEFRKKLALHNFTPHKIGVVGKGVIGLALAEKLKIEGFIVETYDQKESISGGTNLASLVRECNVIFGATGADILGDIEEHLQPNTILASVSSSDREFGGRLLKEKYQGPIIDCHQDLMLDNGVILLNCGFPLNFTGDEHSVPPEKIQLTRALIMAGILSGFGKGFMRRGDFVLEGFIHDSIMRKFREIRGM